MIDFLLQHPALIAMTTLLLAALLGQAWLYRQLRQGTRLLQATLRTSQALQADKQQAEEASRIKSRFLGNIGHEIRTPLNALIGLLELVLQRTQAQDPNRSSIELALGAAGDLRELLADLLDVTRIESGQMSLAPDWTRLRDCVDSVMSIFLILARQKHLELNLEYQVPDPEPLVLIDALRFKQVLSNLLSNAIKFTHRGEVRVRLQLVPGKHPEHFRLRLQVLDTGIGIAESQRQRVLLQPFAQSTPDGQSARDSTGLGLPISHHLCQKMGGSLTLHGRNGPGSEARVRLPLTGRTLPVPAKEEAVLPSTSQPLDILLADDHPASLVLLRGQLEYLGHRVTSAADGLQAYQQWKSGDFDLLIVDCNMPVMNGYELAEAIRQDEALERRPAITLIGYSASNDPQTVQRCLDTGMHDCLFKPLSIGLLSHKLAMLDPQPRADCFNMAALRTLTRGEPRFALRLLKELLQCCHDDRRLLVRISPDNLQELRPLAHKIKGSALMAGADALHECCEALELACLGGAGAELIGNAVDELDLELVRFTQSLHRHLERHRQATAESP
ncbi:MULTISPECIES: response regulator [unclassified Pseudomonas]|uniref:response regulator n=1 Tax=unclassified Pseudomonas TaxID=196821 RepID=UPI000839A6F0|nr:MULTISPECIES: response regulator [unclassified Pseudomonas]QIH09920.1 response regulator [Pseudomonas sp. BIOMIG1BAC]